MNELIKSKILKENEYITVPQLMESLKVSENTIYRWIRKGHLSPTKFRNKNYFHTKEVKNYLNGVFETNSL